MQLSNPTAPAAEQRKELLACERCGAVYFIQPNGQTCINLITFQGLGKPCKGLLKPIALPPTEGRLMAANPQSPDIAPYHRVPHQHVVGCDPPFCKPVEPPPPEPPKRRMQGNWFFSPGPHCVEHDEREDCAARGCKPAEAEPVMKPHKLPKCVPSISYSTATHHRCKFCHRYFPKDGKQNCTSVTNPGAPVPEPEAPGRRQWIFYIAQVAYLAGGRASDQFDVD